MTLQSRGVFELHDSGQPATNTDGPRLTFDGPIESTSRFRYKSELSKGSHGCLKKEKSGSGKKDAPIITLHDYSGEAKVIVKLVTVDGDDHGHKLGRGKGKDATAEKYLILEPSKRTKTTTEFVLQTYIVHVSTELAAFCDKRVENCGVSADKVAELAKTYKKEIENNVILRAEAFDSNNQRICYVDSNCISHTKNSGNAKLNIVTLSHASGSPEGGLPLIILCSPVSKGDIEVIFYAEKWCEKAVIDLVHHQTAIVVITPEYHTQDLIKQAEVNIQLVRRSDRNIVSTPRVFMYTPDIGSDLRRKKQRVAAPNNETCILNDGRSPEQYNTVSQSEPSFLPNEDPQEFAPTEAQYQEMPTPFEPEEGQSGLRNESSNPLLSCGLPDDIVMKTDEEIERDFDESELYSCNYDYILCASDNRDSPVSEPPRAIYLPPSVSGAYSIRHITLAPRLPENIPEPISSSGIQFDSLPVVEPQNYLAYKLALSTARALHEFSQTGDVRFLLTSMRHLIAVQDEHGDNAIHSSVIHAQEEALRNLAEVARTVADYDILNMHNEIKQTPLHIAVCGKQVNMIHVLLYHGADPNVCDSNGNTPTHLAAQQLASTCLDKLLDFKNYVAKYKTHKPDVDAYNFAGFTALHLAVLAGSELNVRSLCGKGCCKVDLLDRTKGRSALHIAVETNNLRITKFLLEEAGAETDIHMFNGNTPLHLACDQDNMEMISLLVQANADPYLENLEMTTREDQSDEERSDVDEDEEFRGLTCLDLAQSDEVRSLLRGEQKLQPVKTAEVNQVAEILVKGDGKPEKKSNVFDSGIGLSGTNLSCSGDIDDDYGGETSKSVADLLDTETKRQLANLLDQDEKWMRVANFLDLKYLIKIIKDRQSPTSNILGYAKMDEFVAALTNLGFHRELNVLQKGMQLQTQTTNVMTKQLEKQVASLSLS